MDYIDAINKFMETDHVSRRELARRIGTTEVSISRYLRRERKPTYEVVAMMVDALGYDIYFRKK